MLSKKEITRFGLKYEKYKYKNSLITSFIFIVAFILRNTLNTLFVNIININSNLIKTPKNRKILFIEPPQQGFGDLLFQTPIFYTLNKSGYKIDVLLKKEHMEVIKNNKNINSIFEWKIRDIIKITNTKYAYTISLGRDTIKSNLIPLLKITSKKIVLDFNLNLWRKSFRELNPSYAWQSLVLKELKIKSIFIKPKIYLSENENYKINKIRNSLNSPLILIVTNINNSLKQYPNWKGFFEIISPRNNYLVFEKKYSKSKNIKFYKTNSYRDAILAVAASDIVVGTEGSLIHIAAAFDKKIVVLESSDSFKKQTFLKNLSGVRILSNHTCRPWRHKNKKELVRLCYLDSKGKINRIPNPCLESITPQLIAESIDNLLKTTPSP